MNVVHGLYLSYYLDKISRTILAARLTLVPATVCPEWQVLAQSPQLEYCVLLSLCNTSKAQHTQQCF